jgi:hypothetical protein
MSPYTIVVAFVAGISAAFGILYLFIREGEVEADK